MTIENWKDWSNRSINGEVCGILACTGDPTSKCPHCNHFYCYEHIKIHFHSTGRSGTSYQSYLRFKKIIFLLGVEEHTVPQLKQITGFKQTTIYKIIYTLIKEDVIELSGLAEIDSRGTKQVKKYRIKQHEGVN